MFVGHFAVAFLLIALFPSVPAWVPLVGVSFPDLLWSVLVWAGREEVEVDRSSPLQRSIVFKRYPFSHSLILTGCISMVLGTALSAALGGLLILPVFVAASSSHWVLDTLVHLGDLPVLGFDGDRKVGLGLWRWGKTAFVIEFVLFCAFALLFLAGTPLAVALFLGALFHAINSNSFLGYGKNVFGTPRAYASAALLGFAVLTIAYSFLL